MLAQRRPEDQGSPAHPGETVLPGARAKIISISCLALRSAPGESRGWAALGGGRSQGTSNRGEVPRAVRAAAGATISRCWPRRASRPAGTKSAPASVLARANPPGRHHGVPGVVIPPVEGSARYPMIFRRAGITESSWRVVLIMTSEASPGVERSGLRSAKSSITCVIAASNSASGCSVRPRSQRRRT
jgi:hypothetical protein